MTNKPIGGGLLQITESEAKYRFNDGEEIWLHDEDITETDDEENDLLMTTYSKEYGSEWEDIEDRDAFFIEDYKAQPYTVEITEVLTKKIVISSTDTEYAKTVAEDMHNRRKVVLSEETLNLDGFSSSYRCVDAKGEKVGRLTNDDLFESLKSLSPVGQAMAIQAIKSFAQTVIDQSESIREEANREPAKWVFITADTWISAAEELAVKHKTYTDSNV